MTNQVFSVRVACFCVLLAWLSAGAGVSQAEHVFFVSPSGDDSNVGTAGAPFASLARARDAVRTWKAVCDSPYLQGDFGVETVIIRKGTEVVTLDFAEQPNE